MGNVMMEMFFRLYIFLDKFKVWIITVFIVGSFSYGFHIYHNIYGLSTKQSCSYTVGLYAVDIKTPKEIEYIISDENQKKLKEEGRWEQIYYASFFSKFTVFLTLLLLYIRKILSWIYRFWVRFRGEHTIVIGLGRNSRFFIDSMLKNKELKHRLIAFEIDKDNPYLDKYKNERISIVVDEIEKMIDKLNIENCKNIFISTGSDEKNIYYALKMIERLEGNEESKKLLVHIEDRTFRNFYSDVGVLNNTKIDMKVFSFNKESARMFFQENRLEGKVALTGDKSFSINIIGGDDLSIALVVEACKLAHYPNGNKLTINCLARDEVALKEKIEYAFPEIKNIKNITINYFHADSNKLSFYDHDVWKDVRDLRHVFYCYDDVKRNISIASKVKERTFLRRRDELKDICFHIATMNQVKISQQLSKNTKEKNFSVFAEANKVCSYENLLDNDIDKIAKLIHYNYEIISPKNVRKGELITKEIVWSRAKVYEKKSSMGQAIHIRTKLHILGIDVIENSEALDTEELYKKNEEVLDKALALKKNFLDFLDRLSESEHRRWMALLMLMDYQKHRGKTDHIQKYHPLLKEFSEFTDKEKEEYAKYDRDAILEMAKYEAEVGNLLTLKNG